MWLCLLQIYRYFFTKQFTYKASHTEHQDSCFNIYVKMNFLCERREYCTISGRKIVPKTFVRLSAIVEVSSSLAYLDMQRTVINYEFCVTSCGLLSDNYLTVNKYTKTLGHVPLWESPPSYAENYFTFHLQCLSYNSTNTASGFFHAKCNVIFCLVWGEQKVFIDSTNAPKCLS